MPRDLKSSPASLAVELELLKGVREIAAYIAHSEKLTYDLLRTGKIPGGKVGGTWLASKAALREHFDRLTRSAAIGASTVMPK